jgi:hypothetical protein
LKPCKGSCHTRPTDLSDRHEDAAGHGWTVCGSEWASAARATGARCRRCRAHRSCMVGLKGS